MLQQSVQIPPIGLPGDLVIPAKTGAIIVFAHGSGSSRHSNRNRYVAEVLQDGRLATLLMDLLTAEEEQVDVKTGEFRFDINLLAIRLIDAANWLQNEPATRNFPIGLFGASTGGGAALVAAAAKPEAIGAVVSRGGRPDLAGDALGDVRAPTLLIVGGNDAPVIGMNQWAITRLLCETELAVVPGASHLFEEPGALETVARLARNWFERHLAV